MQRLAGIADAGGQGRRDHRARAPHRRGALGARAQPRHHARSINPMNRAQLADAGAAVQLAAAAARRRASATSRPSSSRQTTAIQAERPAVRGGAAATWKDWLAFHFIQSSAQFLPRAFDEANFDFYSRTLRGVRAAARPLEARPRRAQRHARRGGRRDLRPPPLPGREPPPDDRAGRQSARRPRRAARRASPGWTRRPGARRSPSWTPSIRGSAIRSGSSTIPRSGSIRNDLLGNMLRAGEFQWNLQLSRLPNPVDRSLWAMTPQTINAYYSPLTNQITFPAAILQPPYLQPAGGPGGQLRRDRRGDRPRDRPRLRRPGPPLRRHRADPRLVDAARRDRRFTERTARLGAQYQLLRRNPRPATSTARSPWARISAISAGSKWPMPPISATSAQHGRAAGDRRADRRPALLPRLMPRPGAATSARGRFAQQRADRSAQPARIAGQRRRPQRRRLVRAFNIQPGDRLYLPPEQRVHIW